ncbi:MAG TPA: glycosyltransferase family 39 protein [Chthonomonadales bacterium]|nr:glycosyltransferase family 39 protein [Chthonomonadales bacterium]
MTSVGGGKLPFVLLLTGICCLAFFWRLGGNGLFDLDEGLYAAAAREMYLHRDFITPRVNGEAFFEKPPFAYWAAAGMMSLFGVNEFAARLPSALATTATVFLLFGFGLRYFGTCAGGLAACFYALSPLVLGEARQLTTDALLILFITAAIFCFFQGHTAQAPTGRRWFYSFWAASGLAVLTKGVVGLLLPILVAIVFLLFAERFRWREIVHAAAGACPLGGLLLFLSIALPWHLAAWLAEGDLFWNVYVIQQHVGRFRGGDTAHRAPFWFFLPAFLVGFFPWSVFVPSALCAPRRCELSGNPQENATSVARLLLIVWAIVVFIFFSASGSKLVSYILPMYPAAALLVGDWCARVIDQKEGRAALLAASGAALLIGLLLFGIVHFHEAIIRLIKQQTHRPVPTDQVTPAMLRWATHQCGAAALTTGALFFFLLLNRRRAAFTAAVAGMVVFAGVAVIEGLPVVNATFCAPLQSLAAQAGRESASGIPVALYIGSPRRPSVHFYLPDRFFLHKPERGLSVPELVNDAEVDRFLAMHRPALLLTTEHRAVGLLQDPSIHILASRKGWMLLQAQPLHRIAPQAQ